MVVIKLQLQVLDSQLTPKKLSLHCARKNVLLTQ